MEIDITIKCKCGHTFDYMFSKNVTFDLTVGCPYVKYAPDDIDLFECPSCKHKLSIFPLIEVAFHQD